MITKKKNRFLTFCFSLMPGAAQMYMGFFKNGTFLMIAFVLLIWVGDVSGSNLSAFSLVVWFFSFCHANHLASLNDEEFSLVKDDLLLGVKLFSEEEEDSQRQRFVEKYHKGIACVLIFVGISLLWGTITNIAYATLPDEWRFVARAMDYLGSTFSSILIGGVIIYMGVRLLRGKKVNEPASPVRKEQESVTEEKENQG